MDLRSITWESAPSFFAKQPAPPRLTFSEGMRMRKAVKGIRTPAINWLEEGQTAEEIMLSMNKPKKRVTFRDTPKKPAVVWRSGKLKPYRSRLQEAHAGIDEIVKKYGLKK